MAVEFLNDGWEVRQETPPQAYIHISRPCWGDANMNGIHLETYVLDGQIARGYAPVALHCEGGYPHQERFIKVFGARVKGEIEKLDGSGTCDGWILKEGSSVLEASVPLGDTPDETVKRLSCKLRCLQTLAPTIDKIIADLESDMTLGIE